MATELTAQRKRIPSLDVLRGLVIVLMAIDHVRDLWAITPFRPEDVSQTTPGWFFTRWITHFCAPVFVFLAGTSAFLYGQKVNDKPQLSKFLFIRGLWLILIEVVVVNSSWTFALPASLGFVFLQVIWAIGISMLALAGLVWLKAHWIALISLLMIGGHNLFDAVTSEDMGSLSWVWKMAHEAYSYVPVTERWGLVITYPIIPWIGVMGIGYVFGQVMQWEASRRQQWLWRMGLGLVIGFIALRYSNIYGNFSSWSVQEQGAMYTLMDFIGVAKYPPSLLFLMMTLGLGLLLLWLFERWQNRLTAFLKVFGQVPFFFYIIHIPIINVLASSYHYLVYGSFTNYVFMSTSQWPENYEASIGLLYLVWAVLLIPFYYLCRWFARYKSNHRDSWWLKYL